MSATELSVQIYLLGRFEVAIEGQKLPGDAWTRRKAAALLQRLALDRRLVKDKAIDFLWPDATTASGSNNLYRTIYALRQTLEGVFGPNSAERVFSFNEGVLVLNDLAWVDAHEFERLAAHPQMPTPDLQCAIELYQGDLLPDDPYSDWLNPHRERLRRLYREVCLLLADRVQEQGDYSPAQSILMPLLAYDPIDEAVHRRLIHLYALQGQRHKALRQYQSCLELLEKELGVPPEPETEALYERLQQGELTPLGPSISAQAGIPPAPLAIESEHAVPFTGRQLEMETILHNLKVARQNQGRVIFVTGETGVGKTRLAYESLKLAAADGMITLYGASYEQEGQLPYQPFIEAFNRYLVAGSRPLTENPITHHKPLGVTDPQQQHWVLFNATAAFLANLAAESPVVFLIDDLQAADETSLHLFHFLARQTRNTPVVLIATYRTDIAIDPTSPFGALLSSLFRERLQITLNITPMAQNIAAELIELLVEGEPTTDFVNTIHRITDGNPLFMEETIQSLLDQGQLRKLDGRWRLKSGVALRIPTGLRGLMQERVAKLGEAAISALESAAVIGREFTFELLQRVNPLGENDLFDALDTALQAHLLEETVPGYRFRHGFVRRVLYESQSRARIEHQHMRVVQAIEAAFGSTPERLLPHVEALAYHATHSHQRHTALPYLLQAGQKAAQLYAMEVAADYFEQALALMDEFHIDQPGMRWQILEGLGMFSIILANTVRTVECFEAALTLPATESWQAHPRDRVRVHRYAAVALITAGDTAAAEKHLTTALTLVNEEEDAGEYAYLLYTLAQLHWHRNEYQTAFNAAQKSLTIAERIDDLTAVARAFEMMALACHSTGNWQQGLLFEEQRSALAGPELDVTEAFDVHL